MLLGSCLHSFSCSPFQQLSDPHLSLLGKGRGPRSLCRGTQQRTNNKQTNKQLSEDGREARPTRHSLSSDRSGSLDPGLTNCGRWSILQRPYIITNAAIPESPQAARRCSAAAGDDAGDHCGKTCRNGLPISPPFKQPHILDPVRGSVKCLASCITGLPMHLAHT